VPYTATGHYSDGSSQDLTATAVWESSLPSVATVTSDGVVTTVGAGTASISATVGSVVGSADINVKVLSSISLSPPGTTIVHKGAVLVYTATGLYADGSNQDLTATAVWESTLTSVATVTSAGNVTTVGAGTTTINATVDGIVGSAKINVKVLSGIELSPATTKIVVGAPQQYTAIKHYSDGSTQTSSTGIQWSSSTPAVATIDANGVASGVSSGTTTITASIGAIHGTANLTVIALTGISITPATASILVGDTQLFTVNLRYSDGSSTPITTIPLASSVTSVATISGQGAKGVGRGVTTITATFLAFHGSATLNVGGTISLPVTGQTDCWDNTGAGINCAGTGQDGEVQAGVNPGLRWGYGNYVGVGDGCITDNHTGLMWTVNADSAGSITWQASLDYIKTLNSTGYCGFSDWRMPNRFEMRSLINHNEVNSSDWLMALLFTNVKRGYWSSTSDAGNTNRVWEVDMNTGEVYSALKSETICVWPVRGGQ